MADLRGPIRLGIIGCGRVAEERHLPALRHLRGHATVVAAADVEPARVARLADRFGIEHRFADYRALLDRSDIAAVGVLTPTLSHAEIALAALDAGKHVLIEKPLALNLAECDRLIARAASSPSKIVVGFNLRWHRLVRRARSLLQLGALGRIKAVRSVYTHYRLGEDAPSWHRKLELGGGVAFNEAVHHFDLWRFLMETEVEQLVSFHQPSAYFEDETHVTNAKLANGALASGVFSFQTGPNSEVEIYGEQGRLYVSCYRFDGLELFPHATYPGDIRDRLKKAASALRDLPQTLSAVRRGGDFQSTFFAIWRHFIDCIAQDKVSECTLEDGRRALAVALAAAQSISEGRPVFVPQ